jgi:hypothetical protein
MAGLADAITSYSGIGVDEIANYLALGRTLKGERRLVRWEQAFVTLGVTASSGTPAALVNEAVSNIETTFKYVGRQLQACVRSWPRDLKRFGEAISIDDCDSKPTDIDLVIDVSDQTSFADAALSSLPSDPTQIFLTSQWARIRQDVLAQPTADICSASFATDATAQKIGGAAGYIRAPAAKQETVVSVRYCSLQLGYNLLGSIPIKNRNSDGGTLNPDLLALLYSIQFRSGESQSEVLAKLRKAVSN